MHDTKYKHNKYITSEQEIESKGEVCSSSVKGIVKGLCMTGGV